MTAEEWAQSFEYVADAGDKWHIPDMDMPNGDCEDFALGVAWILAGQDRTVFKRMFEAGKFNLWIGDSKRSGERHAAIEVDGQFMDTGGRYWNAVNPLSDAYIVNPSRIWRELGWEKKERSTSPLILVALLVSLAAIAFAVLL